ncbi:MAG: ATP-binding protein [Anaerolineae bacterium]
MPSTIPPRELTADQLRHVCNPAQLPFQSTDELEQLNEIIGQERATRAIEFGLDMPSYGYNIFALGPGGAGKTTTIAKYLQRKAATRPVPNDWGYVNNFQQPDSPQALRLPPGGGRMLRDKLDAVLITLEELLPRSFESEAYDEHRKAVVKEIEQRRQEINDHINAFALERGFALVQTATGLLFAPLIDGKAATQEQFNQLPVAEQQVLEAREPELSDELERSLRSLRTLQDETNVRLQNLDRELATAAIQPLFTPLLTDYAAWDEVVEYLQQVQTHIAEHVDRYKLGVDAPGDEEDKASMSPALLLGPPESLFEHYRINVVVDHSNETGAPVVVETNPTYYNLIGRVEQEAQFGTVVSDYSLIKAGSLLQANGGYLVVDARAIVRQQLSFDALKRALRHQQVHIEELSAQYSMIATASLDPEAIPLNVKVILIGDPYTYYWLYAYDEEFQKLFKVRADFTGQMNWTDDNVLKIARFIHTRCTEEALPPFDPGGVAKIVEYSGRLVEDQNKLTTRFADVADIIREAAYWANASRGNADATPRMVTGNDVQRAINERRYRSGLVEERVRESIVNNLVMIDVTGQRIGQVNGLAVLSLGDTMFGKPTRITAKVYLGQSGVVNVEREAKLSGKTHDKGMLILTGFLGGRYAQNKPLSLTATLTFEQSYDGVDGDSASSSELYALLSALAQAPIRQGIAVTGSVNQHGEIQAIGGATAKIEGFFDVCAAKGLTGEQGVLLPAANVPTLMLREDVINAVAAGQFHIYPVTTVDEGITVLTGVPAGERDAEGHYPDGSLNRRVDDALTRLALRLRNFGKTATSKESSASRAENDRDEEAPAPEEPILPGDRPENPDSEPELPGDDPSDPEDAPELPGDEARPG